MLTYPNIDPVLLDLGVVKVRWYGMMYLLGFLAGWLLARRRASRSHLPGAPYPGWTSNQVDDLITYCVVGLVLGARLGYVLFYNFEHFLAHPLSIVMINEGGMSFHGGLLGLVAAAWWFIRRHGKSVGEVADFVAPLAPPGLFFGRIGNFINAELWGKVTDSPLGMVFPTPDAGLLPRHPSQLYEAALEGLVLFVVLWIYSSRPRPRLAVLGLFLLLYGVFRFAVEFVREPDAQLGYLAFDWLTMGQLLCVPMILVGGAFLLRAYRRKPQPA